MSDSAGKPLISIVLPTYNGARYLAESIQSCIDQTYSHWELIIVDDCSTDETPDIIQRYCQRDPRIRAIRHEQNRKLPAALNTGFAEAKGELYTWTSDDNRYLPDALATMQGFLAENQRVGVVYSNFFHIDERGSVLRRAEVGEPEALIDGNCIGCCFLYRREVALAVGEYADDLYLAEDYDFWLRASHHGMKPLKACLYQHRRHPVSLTATKKQEIASAVALTLRRNLPRMGWLGHRTIARGHIRIFQIERSAGHYQTAVQHLILAFRLSPARTFHAVLLNPLRARVRRILR